MGGKFKREGTRVYLWLTDVDVWQKPTKFCKAIILQLNINKLKKKKNMETKQHSTKKKNVSFKISKMNSQNSSRQMKIKTQLSKSFGCSRSSSKREDYIDT